MGKAELDEVPRGLRITRGDRSSMELRSAVAGFFGFSLAGFTITIERERVTVQEQTSPFNRWTETFDFDEIARFGVEHDRNSTILLGRFGASRTTGRTLHPVFAELKSGERLGLVRGIDRAEVGRYLATLLNARLEKFSPSSKSLRRNE